MVTWLEMAAHLQRESGACEEDQRLCTPDTAGQGVLREKSDMQVAEEMQSGWLQVAIGYFAFANTEVRGG